MNTKTSLFEIAFSTLLVVAAIAACDESSDDDMQADEGDDSKPRTIELTQDIVEDLTLHAEDTIHLKSIVFVRGATLTIEPGTTILGEGGSALVIDSDAKIIAEGTADAPIVMTSALPTADRNRGDWGGLVLIGKAKTNLGTPGSAEGFVNPVAYGGDDDTHNCGSLRYLRVEWAGYELSSGNELNGITLYACGSQTVVDHVQVHMGQDDGIEMFGGTFDANYLVVTGAADDSIDCDQGYRGNLQHIFIAQDPSVGDNAFEWSNQGNDFVAEPRTNPRVANATVIGSGSKGDKSKGITFKEGTFGAVYNSLFVHQTDEVILLTHPQTRDSASDEQIVLQSDIFFDNAGFGVDEGAVWTPEELEMWVLAETNDNKIEVDPALPSVKWGTPNIQPAADSPAASVEGSLPNAFEATTYAGAVAPGAAEDWTQASWINYTR